MLTLKGLTFKNLTLKVNLTKADIKRVLLDRYKASRKECLENITEKK